MFGRVLIEPVTSAQAVHLSHPIPLMRVMQHVGPQYERQNPLQKQKKGPGNIVMRQFSFVQIEILTGLQCFIPARTEVTEDAENASLPRPFLSFGPISDSVLSTAKYSHFLCSGKEILK